MIKFVLLLAFLSTGALALTFPEIRNNLRARDNGLLHIPVQMPSNLPHGTIGEEVVFAVPNGAVIDCIIKKRYDHAAVNGLTMHGDIVSGGTFSLSCILSDDFRTAVSCAGNIRPSLLPHGQYELRSNADGIHTVSLVDLRKYEALTEQQHEHIQSLDTGLLPSPAALDGRMEAAVDSNDILDVMVVYTKAAEDWAGGELNMLNLVNLAFDESNEILENSLIEARLRLVKVMRAIDASFNPGDMGDTLE
jgi:hypothetical protein